jgi:hypothetical protein
MQAEGKKILFRTNNIELFRTERMLCRMKIHRLFDSVPEPLKVVTTVNLQLIHAVGTGRV